MKRCDAEFYATLKARIKETYTDVRVSKTGCLGACSTGTMVVIMPDNIWLGEVGLEDIPEILNKVS